MKYIYGIDIGGTAVKLGFFTEEGKLLRKWSIETDTSDGGKHILPDISREIRRQTDRSGLLTYHIKGIGLGVPGPVLPDGTANGCVALGWNRVDVRQEMEELTGVRNIKVGNDANVAALGEMLYGAAKGHSSGVMVTLGTGVGGGIIIDGKIVSGTFGAGGEIGHMRVNDYETTPCNCGNYGCLEQYVSATGIVRRAEKNIGEYRGDSMLKNLQKVTAKDVFDCAKQGDGLALVIVDDSMKILAKALSVISAVIDPEIYIIGGGVSAAGKIIPSMLKKYYEEYAFHASTDTEIRLAELGNDAGMYGALGLVM